jgi:predicted transcriptional regulator
MKQIERKGSPRRLICALLGRTPGMKIAEISASRGVHARAVARQLDSLVGAGYLLASGYPRRYMCTAKPIPRVVSRAPKSELGETRCRREREELQRKPNFEPAATDLDLVFAQWKRSGDPRA